MSMDAIAEKMRAKVEGSGFTKSVKFDCGADGVIFLDGKSTPNSCSNENREADCTVGITLADLQDMLAGKLQPTTAFMTGKLKVSGDMSVAMRLQRVV